MLPQASEDLLKQHYIDLKDRPFYPGLVKYMNSGPVVAMVGSVLVLRESFLTRIWERCVLKIPAEMLPVC